MTTASGRVTGKRVELARSLMQSRGIDFLLIGPSADLRYMLGMENKPSERLTLAIIPREGPVQIVTPGFEVPLLPPLPEGTQVHAWGETESPTRLAAEALAQAVHAAPGGLHCTAGVGDRLWSAFLLGLQAELPRASFVSAQSVLATMRQIKDAAEIELLTRSAAAADKVFLALTHQQLSGRSEVSLAREIARRLEDEGLLVEALPIVAAGPNSASPHHHADDRTIEAGDVVVLDFGGTLEGYYSDITRTVFVGHDPSAGSEARNVYELVARAQEAAREAARPGISGAALDSVARDIIEGAGYGEFFNHRLGHGIGIDGHEQPYVVSGNDAPLQSGMVFSIEPGVYLPGRFGVRIEDIVALRESGCDSLNNARRSVTVVG